jgi:hypothetical protein
MKKFIISVMIIVMLLPSISSAETFVYLLQGATAPFEGILYTVQMNADILASLKAQKEQIDNLKDYYEKKLVIVQDNAFKELEVVETSYKKQVSLCLNECNKQKAILTVTMILLLLGGGVAGYFLHNN